MKVNGSEPFFFFWNCIAGFDKISSLLSRAQSMDIDSLIKSTMRLICNVETGSALDYLANYLGR